MIEEIPQTLALAPPTSRCALCRQLRKLVESHIIPNAYFRAMKRQHNGKLVSMDTDPSKLVELSQDSLSEPLLCSGCEKIFGKWETQWIHKLRLTAKGFTTGVGEVEVSSFEYESFRCFLISIIWRAAVSSRSEFSVVKFSESLLEEIRSSLYAQKAPSQKFVGNRIRKLVDPSDQLKLGDLENFLSTPMPLSEGGLQGYRLFFAGYVVDFITSKVTHQVSRIRGFVVDTPTLRIPVISIFQVSDFMRVGMSIMGKHARGQVRLSSRF